MKEWTVRLLVKGGDMTYALDNSMIYQYKEDTTNALGLLVLVVIVEYLFSFMHPLGWSD